jgi:hypothetical protein
MRMLNLDRLRNTIVGKKVVRVEEEAGTGVVYLGLASESGEEYISLYLESDGWVYVKQGENRHGKAPAVVQVYAGGNGNFPVGLVDSLGHE